MTTFQVARVYFYNRLIFESAFLNFFLGSLWTCVPSHGHEGPVKVRKQPQDTKQERKPHQALSEQAPFHLEGKHITDYLACVETTQEIPSLTIL